MKYDILRTVKKHYNKSFIRRVYILYVHLFRMNEYGTGDKSVAYVILSSRDKCLINYELLLCILGFSFCVVNQQKLIIQQWSPI